DVQRRTSASLTSRMHALWSVGALAGTVAGTAALGAGIGVVAQTVAVCGGALLLVGGAGLGLRRVPIDGAGPSPSVTASVPVSPGPSSPPLAVGGRARRAGRRWGLVVVAAMAVAAVEGVANEWS